MTASQQLIQAYYAAFNDGDMDAFRKLLGEDVVHDINHGDREHGRDAFLRFMEAMNRSYKEHIRDLVVFASQDGSRAAAEFVVDGEYLESQEGLPPATGQRYSLPAGAFFEIADGEIQRVTNYYNLRDWLAQVSKK